LTLIEREVGTNLSEIFPVRPGRIPALRTAMPREVLETIRAASSPRQHCLGAGLSTLFPLYTVWLKASPEEHMARADAQGYAAPNGRKQRDALMICAVLKAATCSTVRPMQR
jgi:hypothetical protein